MRKLGWAVLLVLAGLGILIVIAMLAAVVVFVCLVSFARRDPWVLNSGDLLIFVLAFYLMLAPSGATVRHVRDRPLPAASLTPVNDWG